MFTHHSVTQTVAADQSPITVLDAKLQLHLDTTEDDLLIASYIRAATAYAEHYTQRCLLRSQYVAFYYSLGPITYLPFPPALPDDDPIIEYRDGDIWSEIPASDYYYDAAVHPAVVAKANCASWPCPADSCYPARPNYRITWWAGYGQEGARVPILARQAIMLLTAHYYERRLASDNISTATIPFGVKELLDALRWRFYL